MVCGAISIVERPKPTASRAAPAAVSPAGPQGKGVQVLNGVAGVGKQGPAQCRGLGAMPPAQEQYAADAGLECLDLLGERGLGHRERAGRGTVVSVVRHRDKRPQQSVFHSLSLSNAA